MMERSGEHFGEDGGGGLDDAEAGITHPLHLLSHVRQRNLASTALCAYHLEEGGWVKDGKWMGDGWRMDG